MTDVHFELFIKKHRKADWQLHDVHADRPSAVKRAEELIAAREALSVKVMKETFSEETGEFSSLKVYDAGEDLGEMPEKVKAPAELPCFQPQDLYSLHARTTIARLLKDHLTAARLTAIELLHRADAVERLEATGTVLQHAIQKVAVAHAGSTNQQVQDVVRKLNELVGKAVARIYQDERAGRFPKLVKDSIAELYARIAGRGDAEYILSGSVARRLAGCKSYSEKLSILLSMMDRLPEDAEARDACLGVVDGFIAEMLAAPAALAELIGDHEDLGSSLLFMADLFLGEFPSGQSDVDPGVKHLAREFKRGKLVNARSALAQRIMTELKGVKRLCPSSLEDELSMARRLATKMVMGQGKFLSIEEITEAFAVRSKRFVSAELINDYVSYFETADERLERLMRLEENVIGAENKRMLAGYVVPLLQSHASESQFFDNSMPVLRRLSRLSELQKLAQDSGFQDLNKRQIAEAVDQLAVQVAERAGLLMQIERRDINAVDKVILLLRLCTNDILPEGELRKSAQVMAGKLMRRSDFAASLQAVAPEERGEKMAELRELLQKAGLKGEDQSAA